VSELVRSFEGCSGMVVVSCCCQKLVAKAGVTFREPRGRGTSIVESHYHAATSENITVDINVCV
jgi:hypothetical protein